MRLVVQRVEKAKVTKVPEGKLLGEIGLGLFILFGAKKGDSDKDAINLAEKISKLRVMSDKNDKMNLNIKDAGGKILVVSQFTLNADISGGNRPSFINAEEPVKALKLYELFISELKSKGIEVETGSFGDYMQIETVLDGPVTIIYSD